MDHRLQISRSADNAARDGGMPRSASVAGTTFPASESECRAGRATERHGVVPSTTGTPVGGD